MHTQNKYPAWQSWIENVNEIREELEGYNYSLSDTLLLTKFQDQYYGIMDVQHGYNANMDLLFTKMFAAEDRHLFTWQKLLTM